MVRTVRDFFIESMYDTTGGNDVYRKYIVIVALQWPCMYKAQPALYRNKQYGLTPWP